MSSYERPIIGVNNDFECVGNHVTSRVALLLADVLESPVVSMRSTEFPITRSKKEPKELTKKNL